MNVCDAETCPAISGSCFVPAAFPSLAGCERVEGWMTYRQVREAGRRSGNQRHMGLK